MRQACPGVPAQSKVRKWLSLLILVNTVFAVCRFHAQARACSEVQEASRLAVILGNIHTYYSQFRQQAQACIDSA